MAVNEGKRTGDVQALHRALDVLETIGAAGSAGVSEVARQLGLHVSTVHNILRTLTRRHYLLNDNGRYRLGPAVTVLASQWDPEQSLPALVTPALQGISRATGQAATATVLVGSEGRKIGYEPGTGPLIGRSPVWRWPNPLALPTSRLLVAMSRQDQWDDHIRAGKDVEPGWSHERWVEELRQVAANGLCLHRSASASGLLGLAVPVWATPERVVASLGCSAPVVLVDDGLLQKMMDACWAAATHVSAALGCPRVPLPKPAVKQQPRPPR